MAYLAGNEGVMDGRHEGEGAALHLHVLHSSHAPGGAPSDTAPRRKRWSEAEGKLKQCVRPTKAKLLCPLHDLAHEGFAGCSREQRRHIGRGNVDSLPASFKKQGSTQRRGQQETTVEGDRPSIQQESSHRCPGQGGCAAWLAVSPHGIFCKVQASYTSRVPLNDRKASPKSRRSSRSVAACVIARSPMPWLHMKAGCEPSNPLSWNPLLLGWILALALPVAFAVSSMWMTSRAMLRSPASCEHKGRACLCVLCTLKAHTSMLGAKG